MTEFWTKTDQRAKWLETPFDEFLAVTAEALIKKHNLRTEYGEVMCWNCRGRVALMPHLHCRECFAEAKIADEKRRATPFVPRAPTPAVKGDKRR